MDPSAETSGTKVTVPPTTTVTPSVRSRSITMEELKAKKSSIHMEMKCELLKLCELSKKVKTEGVRESIEKMQGLLNMLKTNRSERKVLRR